MTPLTRPVPRGTAAQAVTGLKRHALTLSLFAALFIALALVTYTRESATWDEPIHLADGYLSLTHRDYRVDIEHPPLVRLWAALPLLALPVHADVSPIDDASSTPWVVNGVYSYARRFAYVDNDADRLLYAARFMIVVLGVLLGVFLYAWTHELHGWTAAIAVLALYTLEPNLSAHAHLVTTDFGLTCFMFGAVYFAWRSVRHDSSRDAVGFVICTVLAVTSKFSGVILLPILAVLALVTLFRGALTWRRAFAAGAIVGVALLVAIWAMYGFRYLPGPRPGWRFALHLEPWARGGTVPEIVAFVDENRLLPNAFSEGLLLTHFKSSARVAYLAGQIREGGWWYYFPVAILLKTPLTLLALAIAGFWWMRWESSRAVAPFIIIPLAVYLGWSMTAHINIGLRHVLPIYPFLLMLAGAAIARLLQLRQRLVVGSAVLACAIEVSMAYPHTLAFFNILAGGPTGGSRYLVDSNVDWGQDLKGLKRWMDDQHVGHINLAYFGVADPEYYGIDCTFLPGSPTWVDPDSVQAPRLPGYVAVSATLLRGVYGDREQREFYRPLAARTPAAVIGHSIFVYQVDTRWFGNGVERTR